MRTAATWTYRGSSVSFTGATPVIYQSATSQTTNGASSATESLTNSSNSGPSTQTLSVQGGVIGTLQAADFAGKGNVQQFNFVELRSPVRTGDQYTILDQHYTDTAIDADGDGRADALDVAVYARVAGSETIQLPNLPSMQAVRVDTTVLSRVVYSSNGQSSPVVQAALQTWYVAGVGIVRQVSSTPASTGVATTDEQLVSWDGVTGGIGAMAAIPAVVPATSGVFPGRNIPAQWGAVAFPFSDHALVLTASPDFVAGTLASTVDLRGNVLSSTLLSGLQGSGTWAGSSTSNGAVYVEPSAGGAVNVYTLTRVDANGALVGTLRGTSLSLGGAHTSSYVSSLAAAADGSTLWLLWGRWYYDPASSTQPGNELVLQPYSLDGVALAPEAIIDAGTSSGLQISASGGRALLFWWRQGASNDAMFAPAALGSLPTVKTLGAGLGNPSFVAPLRLNSFDALMWAVPPGTTFFVGASGGVLLDANLTPVRAGPAFLDEQIAAIPPFQAKPSTFGSRLAVTTTQSSLLWPGDPMQQMVDSVGWIDATGAALATAPVSSVRYASGSPISQVQFADRILVFGGNNNLTTTVVWLNKGGVP